MSEVFLLVMVSLAVFGGCFIGAWFLWSRHRSTDTEDTQ